MHGWYMGVDPGGSGAIAVIDRYGNVKTVKNKETEADVSEFVKEHAQTIELCVIERVNAMPKQGVSSTFKFGRSFGFLIGLLTAHKVPYELVTPVVWQNAMKCRSGGDKNVTKAAAQRLFPNEKITHATADAILMAEYAKRLANERNLPND